MKETSKAGSVASLMVLLVMLFLVPATIKAHPGAGIAVDREGQIYFLDTGSGLWKIDRQGAITQLSRIRFHSLALDANGVFTNGTLPSNAGTGLDWEIAKVGTEPAILLSSDWPIAIGYDGGLYYQSGSRGHLRIMRSMPSGTTTVFANLPPATSGQMLADINGICAGPDDSLYYTENNAIRRITRRGVIGTVVTVRAPAKVPNIPGVNQPPYLRELAVDAQGNIYVADTGDARVLKITRRGKITTLVQTQSPWAPTAVALFGRDVYVLEYLHTARDVRSDWLPRVRKVTPDGKSTVIVTVDRMPGAR